MKTVQLTGCHIRQLAERLAAIPIRFEFRQPASDQIMVANGNADDIEEAILDWCKSNPQADHDWIEDYMGDPDVPGGHEVHPGVLQVWRRRRRARPRGEPMKPELKLIRLDSELAFKAQCPLCQRWAWLDGDQLYGRVSLQCMTDFCGYHETHNFSREARKLLESFDA